MQSWMPMLLLLLVLPLVLLALHRLFRCLPVTACVTLSCCSVECKFETKIHFHSALASRPITL
jgi:hypothetical protein